MIFFFTEKITKAQSLDQLQVCSPVQVVHQNVLDRELQPYSYAQMSESFFSIYPKRKLYFFLNHWNSNAPFFFNHVTFKVKIKRAGARSRLSIKVNRFASFSSVFRKNTDILVFCRKLWTKLISTNLIRWISMNTCQWQIKSPRNQVGASSLRIFTKKIKVLEHSLFLFVVYSTLINAIDYCRHSP